MWFCLHTHSWFLKIHKKSWICSGRDKLVDLLISHSADVNLKTNNGQSPLYTATFENFQNIVEVLLRSGADVNSQESNGFSPLHVAINKGILLHG